MLASSIWSYENPDKIEILKSFFKKKDPPKFSVEKEESKIIVANSFSVKLTKLISLSEKTAFVTLEKNISYFDEYSKWLCYK